jgi:predicted nucleotidyltransferase
MDMDREQITRTLARQREALARFQVRTLSLFGSTARGDARPDSDIDLLVEFEQPIDLFAFAELRQELESILERKVDLVPKKALRPRLREPILSEAVRVA